jgi:hypothetical protein
MNEQDLHSKGFIRQPDGTWSKGTVVKVGNPELRAAEPERVERKALDKKVRGKGTGCGGFAILFTVHAVRPQDWDNYSVKGLQDMLVHAGIIDADSWDELEGSVRSRKVQSKEEERTEIEIWSKRQPHLK